MADPIFTQQDRDALLKYRQMQRAKTAGQDARLHLGHPPVGQDALGEGGHVWCLVKDMDRNMGHIRSPPDIGGGLGPVQIKRGCRVVARGSHAPIEPPWTRPQRLGRPWPMR